MQTLEQQIIQQARRLPENAQRELLHYIELIRSRYANVKPANNISQKRKLITHNTLLLASNLLCKRIRTNRSVTREGLSFDLTR